MRAPRFDLLMEEFIVRAVAEHNRNADIGDVKLTGEHQWLKKTNKE
jgi:hypothetical protein